jgi:rare lipoprotein A
MISLSFRANNNMAQILVRTALVLLLSLTVNSATAQEVGLASFYTGGGRTASGELYVPSGFTAAHRTLRFGSLVRVGYGRRYVIVRINDRGPHVKGRIIDLSLAAASSLGISGRGLVRVRVEPFLPRPRPFSLLKLNPN